MTTESTARELAGRTQDHLNEYIIAADRKASILITGQFAFLGLAATAISNLERVTESWFRGFVIATAVLGILAILLAIVVIYPRTPSPSEGFIYWGNITQHGSADDFHDAVTSLNDEGKLKTLNEENYALATVAKTKYRYLRWSLRATVAMVLSAAAGGITFVL